MTPDQVSMTAYECNSPILANDRAFKGEEDDSGSEDGYRVANDEPVGAFPGTAADYGRSTTSNSYY